MSRDALYGWFIASQIIWFCVIVFLIITSSIFFISSKSLFVKILMFYLVVLCPIFAIINIALLIYFLRKRDGKIDDEIEKRNTISMYTLYIPHTVFIFLLSMV